MSFYDYDTEQVNEELLPPQLRQPKEKAWLKILMVPLQWIRDLFFDSYIAGSNDNTWDDITTYFPGVRAVYFDNAVYEAIQTNINTPPDLYPDYWFKVQDVFIGVEERLKYNSQIIVYEYALNNWFRNVGATDQIYIQNNVTNTDFFLMGESSVLSSSMSVLSTASTDFMGVVYTPGAQYDYTIMVPAALFATMGATTQDRENAIRNIANKYNMAGMQYSVATF